MGGSGPRPYFWDTEADCLVPKETGKGLETVFGSSLSVWDSESLSASYMKEKDMGEFYTAIGVKQESGPFCVIKQGERVFLARAEQLLWTTLQGQFLEKNEIYPEMCFEKAGGCAKKADEEEVSYCLRRLTNRRLVVKVMANGAEDAQKMLLKSSVVVPAAPVFEIAASTFFRRAFGEPGTVSSHDKLWRKQWEQRERSVLKMLGIFGDVSKYLEAIEGSQEALPKRLLK